MNALATPFKQLKERRLWPIAVLLLAAIVAVPMLLAKDPEPTDVLPPSTAVAQGGETSPADSIVTVVDPEQVDKARSVLGDRKNPFTPDVIAADDACATATCTTAPGAATVDSKVDDTGGATAGGGGGKDTSVGDTPVDINVQQPPKKTYDLYSLTVRFGETTGALEKRNIKRLTGLPGGAHPALLYLGLLSDHKTAVFLVDGEATVQGDGKCDPSPEDCQTLTMKAGETEFIDTAGGKQYQLDLVKIHKRKTTDAEAAKASRRTIARGGRQALRQRLGRIGRYRYSESRGTIGKVSEREQAARVAKAAVVSDG